jgi:hypothetical protein
VTARSVRPESPVTMSGIRTLTEIHIDDPPTLP